MLSNNKGFTLVEILVVIAILAILAGAVFFALNPTEIFRDARNTTRRQDVDAVAAAVRQYILRDLAGDPADMDACVTGGVLLVMDPVTGGIAADEGSPISDAAFGACLSDYIAEMPTAPGGSSYRWGVDVVATPVHVYVGVDSMETVGGELPDDYYLVY